jgi:RecB family exonuclease
LATNELFVVPGERHVERLARKRQRAETRTSLRSRLASALLPDVAFAEQRECRLVLGVALSELEPPTTFESPTGQLELFGAAAPSNKLKDRTTDVGSKALLLAAVRTRGGESWARLVAALDDAITLLRARGATPEHLEHTARAKGFLATRARTLATAMRALDARLARAGARDARLAGALVAGAIRAASADEIVAIVGTGSLCARWLLNWEPADLAWWRALDDKLAPRGGGARVILPAFDRPLAGARERDPLDALADDVARGLDGPAESETITPVLGDFASTPEDGSCAVDASRVKIVSASDALGQARAVAVEVANALSGGAAVERVVVGLPVMDERTLGPLRCAFEDAGIVFHESRGAPPSAAPVVAAALLALEAALSLDRRIVARLLRSGWVDATRLTTEERRVADRRLSRLAHALETSPTAAGADPLERLVRTATMRAAHASRRHGTDAEPERDAALAMDLGRVLARPRAAKTRSEHIRATRALWAELGIGARAGRGGLTTFASDDPPIGVPRAERLAIARDARAWDALVSALDLYETTVARVEAADQEIDAASFRLELLELLDAGGSRPGAGRAAAVRVARLVDVAGDALDLLVVLDANDGLLPRDDAQDALVSESLAGLIARVSRGAFVAQLPGTTRTRELSSLALAASEASSVVLVFPREDASGAAIAPSLVVERLARAGVEVNVAGKEPPRQSGLDVALRISRERQREAFFLDPSRPLSDVVGDLSPGNAAAALLVVETGGGERPLAVTGLERFARCPFMGYAHVVLGARETEQTEELPDSREEGTLLHEALAAAFQATRELWVARPRPREQILGAGITAAYELLERWQAHAALRAIVRLRVGDAVRAVLSVAIDDEAWDFILAEQAFGARNQASWSPLGLAGDDLRLALRGSIDRIDRAHDGRSLRVIDYKRSKSTVVAATGALGETALQVPLYICAAGRELGLPATGAYMATQARDVTHEKPASRATQRMDELVARPGATALAEIEERALLLAARVRSGALAPIPAHESECRFCAVSGGCRKPRFAMAPADEGDDDREVGAAPRNTP